MRRTGKTSVTGRALYERSDRHPTSHGPSQGLCRYVGITITSQPAPDPQFCDDTTVSMIFLLLILPAPSQHPPTAGLCCLLSRSPCANLCGRHGSTTLDARTADRFVAPHAAAVAFPAPLTCTLPKRRHASGRLTQPYEGRLLLCAMTPHHEVDIRPRGRRETGDSTPLPEPRSTPAGRISTGSRRPWRTQYVPRASARFSSPDDGGGCHSLYTRAPIRATAGITPCFYCVMNVRLLDFDSDLKCLEILS